MGPKEQAIILKSFVRILKILPGSKINLRLDVETVVIETLSAVSVCIFNRIVNSGRSVRKLFSHGYDAEFSGESQ
ncbi:MAG: hypothetical protein J9259_09865 [Thermoplasmata archaeon YP2-bin.285]|uniref:Uncharacterized protein n=1 Tax=Candidatus Sysuiplasma superficiale TaxID=2823368 RepID=A0A8J7YLQ1_9ARCH|nr:hypothetical protein [Candidatus Sysuiplasma superficiale]